MSVRALACLLALLIGCGDDGSTDGPVDAGSDAAILDGGPARLQLLGPEVAFVDTEVCFSVLPEQSLTFIWGDGERSEGGPEACHTYGYPGGFVVSAVSATEDASLTLRVVFEPAERRPTASTPIVLDGERGWVVTPDDDSLATFDTESLERTALIDTCVRPRTLALGESVVAVACQGGALAIHDRATGALRSELPLPTGSRPFAVVADPRDGSRLFVSLQDLGAIAQVSVADPDAPELVRTIPIGADVRALTMNDAGVLLATRWRAGPTGSTIYGLDLADPSAPVALPDGLLPVQRDLDSDTDNSGVLSFLDTLVFTPDGIRAIAPALKANNVTGLYRTDTELTSQTTARAALAEVFAEEGAIVESVRHSFDDRDYASALVATEVGDVLYLAFYGAQRIVAVDAFSFDVVGTIANVGIGPRGVALDGERLFVWAELERQVRVYDVTDLSAEPPLLAAIDTIDDEPLDPEVLRGKQIFASAVDPRMSRTSYLSCASCHLDGEGDNLVYDFTQRGEGLRNTIGLHGSAQHFPLHWSGNFDEVQDFENDIRRHQGGTGFLTESEWSERSDPLGPAKAGLSEELDALAAYVTSLTEIGDSPVELTEAERSQGEALFTSAGCTGCHAGPAFTDGLAHDVGTLTEASGQRLGAELTAIDTPALRGLWRSAPYLHDGSAPTLRDVLTTSNPADQHGTTTPLSDPQLTTLERYLHSLN